MNFIEIYDNALPSEDCDRLIKKFESPSTPKFEGCVYIDGERKVDHTHKRSKEVEQCTFGSKSNVIMSIGSLILPHLVHCLDQYKNKYNGLCIDVSPWTIEDGFTFKKFEGEESRYKRWHCEHTSGYPSSRLGVWMFYLNNAEGTEFKYQNNIRAKKGRCVIWPAFWTHIHRGAPNKGTKYIISGWLRFREST